MTTLSRFLFAAVMLAAATLVASTGAWAHSGHAHGPVHVERPVSAPHSISFIRSGKQLTGAVSGIPGFIWMAAMHLSPEEAATTCAGGCCHAAGQGCCAAALPAIITIALPTAGLERPFSSLLWGPGITPGVLPEPPKSLV